MSIRRIARPLQEPYCWNCSSDPGGRQLVTVTEAARYCKVSVNAVYRWMERGLIEWVYNAGGKRRIYKDSLTRTPEEAESAPETDPHQLTTGTPEAK